MGRDGDQDMKDDQYQGPHSKEAFLEWLAREGPAGTMTIILSTGSCTMGNLTKVQLQQWVLNRYYYQTRIPIKDALIVSKSEDPSISSDLARTVFRTMTVNRKGRRLAFMARIGCEA